MADVDHPKTHVEDQNLDGSRTQPESPQHEGIDPLTEGDTMYSKEDTKAEGAKLAKKQAKAPRKTDADKASEQTVADQEALHGAKAGESVDETGSDESLNDSGSAELDDAKPQDEATAKAAKESTPSDAAPDTSDGDAEPQAPTRGRSQGSTRSRS